MSADNWSSKVKAIAGVQTDFLKKEKGNILSLGLVAEDTTTNRFSLLLCMKNYISVFLSKD